MSIVFPGRLYLSIKLLQLQKDEILLNIGCGDIGWLESYSLSRGCVTISLDINKDNIRELKKINRKGKFILGSTIKLPFRNECISKIALLEVLEHLPVGMDNLTINESYRILRKKGICLITVPRDSFLFNLLDPYLWFRHIHRRYKVDYLRNKLRELGFEIKYVKCAFGFLTALFYLVFYFIRKIPALRIMIYKNLRNLTKNSKNILFIISKLCEVELRKLFVMGYNIFLLVVK
jgi:SAM-dependent methyltransferase